MYPVNRLSNQNPCLVTVLLRGRKLGYRCVMHPLLLEPMCEKYFSEMLLHYSHHIEIKEMKKLPFESYSTLGINFIIPKVHNYLYKILFV